MRTIPKTLVVDDSSAVSNMVVQMLKQLGIHDTTQAGNGLNAIKSFKNASLAGTPFELVLLDLMMPAMDGQTTLKILRSFEKHSHVAAENAAVIIIMTSCDSPVDMVDAIQSDCSDYLVKPVSEPMLRSVLSKYIVIS